MPDQVDCSICGKPTVEYCSTLACRSCHKTLTFEDCVSHRSPEESEWKEKMAQGLQEAMDGELPPGPVGNRGPICPEGVSGQGPVRNEIKCSDCGKLTTEYCSTFACRDCHQGTSFEDCLGMTIGKKKADLETMVRIPVCEHCSKLAFPIMQTAIEHDRDGRVKGQSHVAGYFCPETMDFITPRWTWVKGFRDE